MAAKRDLMFDKTEIIVVDRGGGRPQVLNLTYDKIISIQFDKATARKLFSSIPTEKISITIRGRENPTVLFKHTQADFWEEYKAGIEKFTKDNRITSHNYL